MNTVRRALRRAVWLGTVIVLTVAGVFGSAVAGAQADDDPSLTVRSVDGRDPDTVEVEFLWTGPRNQVTDLVVRENGDIVDSTSPVRLDEGNDFGIVLAIDVSGSMEENGAFERAVAAAKQFIADKEPGDQIAVVGFGDLVQVMTQFTSDQAALDEAVDRLGLERATLLRDGIRESTNLFEGTDLVPNIVVLTDGRDSGSETSESALIGLLDDANALVYAIGIESEDLDVEPLERIAQSTGGSVLVSDEPDDLSDLYAEVQERLRQQFSATFVSEADEEGPAELTLTVGATSGDASFTRGARLDSTRQIEPVVIPSDGGIDALQSGAFLWVALALVLVAIGGVVYAVGTAIVRDKRSLDRALQPYSDGFVADEVDEDRLATSAILQRAVELTGDFAERRGVLRRVEDMLERANLPLRAAEALFFYLVAVVILAALGGLLLGGAVGGLVIFVLALLIPPAVVGYLARRRRAEFQSQLPDLLALLASTMRAGYSLMQGVEAAAHEVSEPSKRELQRVVTEARLGMPLEEALHNVSLRMSSRDFAWAVMAIGIQREVGGNLAELLDTVGETMRERDRLRRDISSLTAEGRVSAIVLGVLPIGLGFMIYALNPDYISGLFERGIGVAMAVVAGALMVLGFYWMYRIIDIEV